MRPQSAHIDHEEATSGLQKAKRTLAKEHADLALLIGNGINLANERPTGLSWNQLMVQLVKNASKHARQPKLTEKRLFRLLTQNDAHTRTSATYPEVFDIIDAACNPAPGSLSVRIKQFNPQQHVAILCNQMTPGAPHRAVVRWANSNKVPLMTTNYDHCLQNAMQCDSCVRHILPGSKAKSRFYPWNRYYAPTTISNPNDNFAIWHVHGDHGLQDSMRIGLDQYMGMVQRLRKLIYNVANEALHGPNESRKDDPAYLAAPWLSIFMGKKLWIQGLGLHAAEVSLRWLLIQRFRYWKRYNPGQQFASGWYLHGPTTSCGELDNDRRAFFESVGIETIEIDKAPKIYETLFADQTQLVG